MKFEIIVNNIFDDVNLDDTLTPTNNKSVLGIINDFEEGEWRYEKFQKFVWNNIKETALSHSERKALLADGESSILTDSAKNLRLVESVDAIGRGSEIAEIVLYGIMKSHYSALPIVPKYFINKTKKTRLKVLIVFIL